MEATKIVKDGNPKNKQIRFGLVQYGSGPWRDRWVITKTVQEDYLAFLTEGDARGYMAEHGIKDEP